MKPEPLSTNTINRLNNMREGNRNSTVFQSANEMKRAGKISDHDVFVSKMLAEIICGGDTDISESVNEKKLLDLEKKSILRLLREPLTLDRIEHTLLTGKPLRN